MTGSVLNFPDCGVVTVTGAILAVASKGSEPNFVFISYGTESANNAAAGNTVTLADVHLVDRSGSGGLILNGSALPSARLVIGPGCVYDGTKPPQFQGWASVRGSFTASRAAVLRVLRQRGGIGTASACEADRPTRVAPQAK